MFHRFSASSYVILRVVHMRDRIYCMLCRELRYTELIFSEKEAYSAEDLIYLRNVEVYILARLVMWRVDRSSAALIANVYSCLCSGGIQDSI